MAYSIRCDEHGTDSRWHPSGVFEDLETATTRADEQTRYNAENWRSGEPSPCVFRPALMSDLPRLTQEHYIMLRLSGAEVGDPFVDFIPLDEQGQDIDRPV